MLNQQTPSANHNYNRPSLRQPSCNPSKPTTQVLDLVDMGHSHPNRRSPLAVPSNKMFNNNNLLEPPQYNPPLNCNLNKQTPSGKA